MYDSFYIVSTVKYMYQNMILLLINISLFIAIV